MAIIHPSDCSIHEMDVCDCGGLDLDCYDPESFIPTLVAATGRFGFFVGNAGTECFIEPEQLPSTTLAAIAAAANLPNAHHLISSSADPDGVDFDNAHKPIIAQLKALTLAQGVTSLRLPHTVPPNIAA